MQIPQELQAQMHASDGVRQAFKTMPPSHQAEYTKWISEAKKPATREKRAAESIKKIMEWAKKKRP